MLDICFVYIMFRKCWHNKHIMILYYWNGVFILSKIGTNISIDSELKKEAVKLFSTFGLDLSTAITLFLSQAVREQKIPFEIKIVQPTLTTLKALSEYEEMSKDNSPYKKYDSFKEVLEDIGD